MKKGAACLIICAFFGSLLTFGQNQENSPSSFKQMVTTVDLERNIMLEDDSKTEVIFIEIKQKTPNLELKIQSTIYLGKLTIEVYDPNEVKQGNFTIGKQLDSGKKEMVTGNIVKNLTEPQSGKWKVKIIPSNATGTIVIKTSNFE